MSKVRWIAGSAAAAALVLLGLVLYRTVLRGPDIRTEGVSPAARSAGPVLEIDLYFADSLGRRLALERREIQGEGLEERMQRAIESLVMGPVRENLTPTLPPATGIRSVYFREGTAFVDLTSAVSSGHPGGAWTETLAVYSVVNTLTENFPEVKYVQILVEGREVDTLAGHIDISRPLARRVQLLAGSWE